MTSTNALGFFAGAAPISPAMIRFALRVRKFFGFCCIPRWITSDRLRITRCHG